MHHPPHRDHSRRQPERADANFGDMPTDETTSSAVRGPMTLRLTEADGIAA